MAKYQPVESIEYCGQTQLLDNIQRRTTPLVIRGLVADWPLVTLAQAPQEAVEYLIGKQAQQYVFINEASAESLGRFFYTADMLDKNFTQTPKPLPEFLATLRERSQFSQQDTAVPSFQYMASTSVDYCFPTLLNEHPLPLPLPQPLISAWLGTQSIAATHFDVPENIACNAFGRRRFTLFPPDQVNNLYIGPMDLTPAGQPVSMVEVNEPDLAQYPKFYDAMEKGFQVTLEPGDALYIPSMWWHNVEALDSVNLLINYWWQSTPNYKGAPMDALHHAILAIKDRPDTERHAWKALFDHYVFNYKKEDFDYIADAALGMLDEISEDQARKLRADLLQRLNK